MPKTREYEFDVSIETANIPDPGTPTADNDILTKKYADDNFALLEDWGNDVADITALRAVAAADRANGQVVTVSGINTLYMFNSSSAAADDGDNVIQPDAGSGR